MNTIFIHGVRINMPNEATIREGEEMVGAMPTMFEVACAIHMLDGVADNHFISLSWGNGGWGLLHQDENNQAIMLIELF